VTTAEQSEASAGVWGHDPVGTRPTSSPRAGNTAGQNTPTKPAGSQGSPKRQPKTSGENNSSAPNADGKATADGGGEMTGTPSDANASASVNASTTS
jgi:hypothetical protein